MNVAPVVKDVVLVGGGHSHALVIRSWAMRPVPGVRLTLVSDGVMTPYSGMLPGLVAGHYTVDEVHIDLMRLCLWAGVRFIDARMTALDPLARRIELAGRPAIEYDLLCLDTGSTPDLSVPGAAEHATPVKPVARFTQRWQGIVARLDADASRLSIGVVGSGAGGFEILMAVQHALRGRGVALHWVLRDVLPLGGRHVGARRAALEAAQQAGITVHVGFDVQSVDAGPCLRAADGRDLPLDELLWCTGATGPDWPAAAGLATDTRGFISTDAMLRSVSHPEVFASGDIGTQRARPSPKAGVHAVRQAPVLLHNLKAVLLGQKLRPYRPQRDFLSLMATGPRHAIASRGRVTVRGDWVWRWKDRIDRTFMQRFERLPAMTRSAPPDVLPDALLPPDRSLQAMRCRGCGAKVGGDLLQAALARHAGAAAHDDEVAVGVAEARDVSIVLPRGHALVQSVDQVSALFDDPWGFSRVAALHALGDVLTVQATPHSALLSVTLPPAADSVQRRELAQVLDGVMQVLDGHGVRLIGGHTAEGPQLQIGLTINAFATDAQLRMNQERLARPGDVLLLTRPIGVGVLFAGAMRAAARGEHLSQAVQGMSATSAPAARRLHEHGARALTDVTGFGLAGHLERLLKGSGCAAALYVAGVPILDGARALAEQGVRSSLYMANRGALDRMQGASQLTEAMVVLLADPQTAGGMLAIVPAECVDACVQALSAADDAAGPWIIGVLESGTAHRLILTDAPE